MVAAISTILTFKLIFQMEGGGVALSSGVLFNEILNFNLKNIKV